MTLLFQVAIKAQAKSYAKVYAYLNSAKQKIPPKPMTFERSSQAV